MASVMQAETVADPIAGVLAGFGSRRARIDYAFIKFNLPERGMALLIDFIVRRPRRQIQIRLSLYTPSGGMVHKADYPLSALKIDEQGHLAIADSWLSADGSRGAVGPISWDLVFQSTGPLLDPRIIGRLQPFDLRLRSAPEVLVSGSVRVERQGYSFSHEPGMVGSFHGRRLPDQWYWISANAFEEPGVTLDCMMLHSSIFGLPFWRTRVGYFHLHTPSATYLVMHPLTGRVRLSGDRHDLQITVRPRQEEIITVHCVAPEERFHLVGDRTYTTLVGMCTIDGIATAERTAGIAQREAPRRGMEQTRKNAKYSQ